MELPLLLIIIGIGVVHARKLAVRRWGEGPGFRRLVRALPILSAILITAIGLWLCFDSVRPRS